MSAATANVTEIFASIQGEGSHVGRRHLFVRFGGCPLRCQYCDTPGSLLASDTCEVEWGDGRCEERPNPFTREDLDALVAERAAQEPRLHALALTGGEPLVQATFLAPWLASRRLQLPVFLETAATLPAQLADVLPWIDIVSADIKLPSNAHESAYWDEHEQCLRMSAGRDVYVKMLVDESTNADELDRGARMVMSIDHRIPVFLQPITDPKSGQLKIRPRTLEGFYRRVAYHGVDVRIVPQTHKVLGLR